MALAGTDMNGPKVTHGRRSTYVRGCRCAECRRSETLYKREWRERRRAGQRPQRQHDWVVLMRQVEG